MNSFNNRPHEVSVLVWPLWCRRESTDIVGGRCKLIDMQQLDGSIVVENNLTVVYRSIFLFVSELLRIS